MYHRVLGWPPDGPRLRLDYRAFAYAGKFHGPDTGVTATLDPDATPTAELDLSDAGPPPADPPGDREWTESPDTVVAAVACNADRTAPSTLWLRYVTVRRDRRGEGVAPRLARFTAARAADAGFDTARIAVNNVFSYHALWKAGFVDTGRETGLAERVLERPTAAPADGDDETYRAGLRSFAERDLAEAEASFLAAKAEAGAPEIEDVGAGDG
ncbi:GNAT family N-acetyltransferase [Halobaculum sp. MBLA0143]|uniref:GNAT family N-acetyltransferase n=1 Tax=Halobaculum sp. MBLA0143 TaxID=3079933 RepID=UPI003525581B